MSHTAGLPGPLRARRDRPSERTSAVTSGPRRRSIIGQNSPRLTQADGGVGVREERRRRGKTKGGEGVPPHVAAPSPPYTYLAQSPSDCEHSSGIHGAARVAAVARLVLLTPCRSVGDDLPSCRWMVCLLTNAKSSPNLLHCWRSSIAPTRSLGMSRPPFITNSESMGAITSVPQQERPMDLHSWPRRFVRPKRVERGTRVERGDGKWSATKPFRVRGATNLTR
jgi:hypothetical protein